MKAHVDWLVCKETCIPESVELALTLPVAAAAGPDPTWAAPIEAARRALPRPLTGWQASAAGQGSSIALTLVPPAGAGEPGTLRFFPYAEREIEPSVPQKLTREGDAYRLVLPVANDHRSGSFERHWRASVRRRPGLRRSCGPGEPLHERLSTYFQTACCRKLGGNRKRIENGHAGIGQYAHRMQAARDI